MHRRAGDALSPPIIAYVRMQLASMLLYAWRAPAGARAAA
jgi:hypothetical protein